VKDALIATSTAQSLAMWKLRESVPEAQRRHGASLKHDVSVPIARVPELIEEGSALVGRLAPEGDVVSYGHLGDGNLHFNVSQRPGTDAAAFLAAAARSNTPSSTWWTGSAAASARTRHRPAEDRRVRGARRSRGTVGDARFEACARPQGILNPGKVFAC